MRRDTAIREIGDKRSLTTAAARPSRRLHGQARHQRRRALRRARHQAPNALPARLPDRRAATPTGSSYSAEAAARRGENPHARLLFSRVAVAAVRVGTAHAAVPMQRSRGRPQVLLLSLLVLAGGHRRKQWSLRRSAPCARLFSCSCCRPCLPGCLLDAEGGEVDAVDAVGLAADPRGEQVGAG
jgi:hypothetical protein